MKLSIKQDNLAKALSSVGRIATANGWATYSIECY